MSDTISRRLQTSPTSLDDLPEVLPTEILLHLPSPHHHLLSASQVCPEWRRLVRDPEFLRRFRARHNGTPPLIGVFHDNCFSCNRRFTPTGDDRTATGMFQCWTSWRILDCRHGRVLFLGADEASTVLVVWDPMTGSSDVVTMPSDWTVCDYDKLNGAVVCTGTDDADGRHGDCRSSPFLVVLLTGREQRAVVSVYSSAAREWSEVILYDGLPIWANIIPLPCVVIGSTVYQPLHGSYTLSFDLETMNFSVIPHPQETKWSDIQIMKLDGTMLGLVVADHAAFSLHFWALEEAGDWVLRRTVKLEILLQALSAPATSETGSSRSVKLLGACEYGNAIFLGARFGTLLFSVYTMELKKLSFGQAISLGTLYPYESFYAPRLWPEI